MDIMEMINSVGFPIFACIYLTRTNDKILNTVDKRLEILDVKLNHLLKEVKRSEQT